ncbi:hypothetical protein [Bartonella queenslandensis]|uniref:hypothetical protein n=1 Tax=Bartonella queenslandensis TaxID=481138 RepID=UPI001BAC4BB4|nr:hypothetical protein [Bartonella queenslandensis]
MIKDQSQQQSTDEGKGFISQSVLDQSAAFKKGMLLSTKDYVIIFCLAILLLVLFVAITYMQPWDFFHVISKEQLQEMGKQGFDKLLQESLIRSFQNNPAIEYLRNVGWNSVWAFLCFVPQVIFGALILFFPLFSIFNAILKRDVKEMMLLWETVPEQQRLDNQSLDKIR